MGQHLSPRYGQVILVSGYPVLTAVNWSKHLMCNMCAISVILCSQTGEKVWDWTLGTLWCGRTGGRCTVTWLPNFLGWVDLLTHGALQARFARRSSANSSSLLLIPLKKIKILTPYRNEKLFVKVGVTVNLSPGQQKINGKSQLSSHSLLNTFD